MNKKRKLLSAERERVILSALSTEARSIGELSDELKVSEATVRRDLQSLEKRGKAKRVHGGAIIRKKTNFEPLFTEKESFNKNLKYNIAARAFKLIEDGDIIYLDGGTTVLELAKLIKNSKIRSLTVVTNSIMAAAELMDCSVKLVLCGGECRSLSRTLVGPLTEPVINRLHLKKAFMGTIGLSAQRGMSTTDPAEAYTKRLILDRSDKVILLADSSKTGIDSFAENGSVDNIDILISDKKLSEEFIRLLLKKHIEVFKV